MRFKITLSAQDTVRVPIDHGKLLREAAFTILERGDPALAKWLRGTGYIHDGKVFRMFGMSGLRASSPQRRIEHGAILAIAVGEIQWFFASPVPEIVDAFRDGIDRTGAIEVSGHLLIVTGVEEMPFPENWGDRSRLDAHARRYRCICYSPISVVVRASDPPHYYRPTEAAFFGELRADLEEKRKIALGESALRSEAGACFPFSMWWDASYIRRDTHQGRKKTLIDKDAGLAVVGCMAPFTIDTTPEMMHLIYYLGLGTYNSFGLGMIAPLEQHKGFYVRPRQNSNLKRKQPERDMIPG